MARGKNPRASKSSIDSASFHSWPSGSLLRSRHSASCIPNGSTAIGFSLLASLSPTRLSLVVINIKPFKLRGRKSTSAVLDCCPFSDKRALLQPKNICQRQTPLWLDYATPRLSGQPSQSQDTILYLISRWEHRSWNDGDNVGETPIMA